MTVLQGLVEHVETYPALSFATADAAISATEVFVADVAPFLTDAGTVSVDIAGLTYTATPDAEDDSLTVSPALTVAVAEGDPIVVLPAAEVKLAYISFDPDGGDLVPCRVPHSLIGYESLADGPRDMDERESVEIETEPEPHVLNLLNQPPVYNASTAPIIVTTPAGETIRRDGDGDTATTNDPIELAPITGNFTAVAANLLSSGTVAAVGGAGRLRLFEGDELLTGFPVAGPFSALAAYSAEIYAIKTSDGDIHKYDAFTGAEDVTGTPIVGTFTAVAAFGPNVWAIDGSADIRKYNDSGVENLSGFPKTGTFVAIASNGAWLCVTDSAGDLRKINAVTGVEDTTGEWPIDSGTDAFDAVTIVGSAVYAVYDLATIRKFDLDTGDEDTDFAFDGSFKATLAGDDSNLFAVDADTGDILVFNLSGGFVSYRLNSSEGAVANIRSDVQNLTARYASIRSLGHSDFKTLATTASPTDTTNINMNDLDMSVVVEGTTDVVWVNLSAAVRVQTAGADNIIELMVDGVAHSTFVRVGGSGGAANTRYHPSHTWRLTGLSAGSHTIEFRTRSDAAARTTHVQATETTACFWTSV